MSKVIVGRYLEKKMLDQALSSKRSELVAVYGRRRIGKTYLIREYYSKHIIFSFSGLRNGRRKEQIENFMIELNERLGIADSENPDNWLQTFHLLKKYLMGIKQTQRKKVIFIDEFPWVDTLRSGFLPAFENFWNTYCATRNDLIVVICGSAASYMLKKVIRNRGGLHNRITVKIKLLPFQLKEVKELLDYKGVQLPEIEVLKIFMAFGGIAAYLEHIQPGDTSVTAIDRICFQQGGQLEYEFDEVFKSLFEENSYHEMIIKALAKGPKRGMSRDQILAGLQLNSGGQFSKSMDELLESGFIEKYESYQVQSKVSLYRIFDEFCLFHQQFMQTSKGNSWKQLHLEKKYQIWCGYAFEMICFKHIENIKKGLRCDQISSRNYSWSNSKSQIDLVIDRVDNMVNLCEIKFYNGIFTLNAAYADVLRNKEEQFKITTNNRKGVNTIMLTTWGVDGKHAKGLVSQNLTMGCLFL